jgi:hypothetical protein
MQDEFVLTRTNVFDSYYRRKNVKWLYLRDLLLQVNTDICDHGTAWALKPKKQRGTARIEQLIIIAFPYYVTPEKKDKVTEELRALGMAVYTEQCTFRKNSAVKVIIYNQNLDLHVVLRYINDVAIPLMPSIHVNW